MERFCVRLQKSETTGKAHAFMVRVMATDKEDAAKRAEAIHGLKAYEVLTQEEWNLGG